MLRLIDYQAKIKEAYRQKALFWPAIVLQNNSTIHNKHNQSIK